MVFNHHKWVTALGAISNRFWALFWPLRCSVLLTMSSQNLKIIMSANGYRGPAGDVKSLRASGEDDQNEMIKG